MKLSNYSVRGLVAVAVLASASVAAAQSEIMIPGKRVFPESITSTKDGTIIIGSLGFGNVLRVAPGKTSAEEWIRPGTGGLNMVLGVFADEKNKTLWVCSNNLENKGEATALKGFDLKTGTAKGTYPLPGEGSLCNDAATGSDGTVYVADTRLAQVLMLKKGAKALEIAAKDAKLAGVDGLAFGSKKVLYVNSVSAGKLFRLDLGADGKSTAITELTLSRPLQQPDGMRAVGTNRMLLAEGAGKMDLVMVTGDKANITTLKEGMESTPGVTLARGMAWVNEGKLNLRADTTKDAGTFKIYGVPMPK